MTLRSPLLYRTFLLGTCVLLSLGSGGCASWFGRGSHSAATSNPELVAANGQLRTEAKMLQTELEIARREQDTLRRLLETQSGSGSAPEIARLSQELAQARGELAQLRTSSAKASGATTSAPLDSARVAQLEAENASLREEVQQVREENARLATRARDAETSLTQINYQLAAQRDARAEAEQQVTALRSQLEAVMASGQRQRSSALANLPATTSDSATGFSGQVQVDSATAAATTTGTPLRIHTVAPGDNLESIAEKYFGDRKRWTDIYVANHRLLRGGRNLEPGMELTIPKD